MLPSPKTTTPKRSKASTPVSVNVDSPAIASTPQGANASGDHDVMILPPPVPVVIEILGSPKNQAPQPQLPAKTGKDAAAEIESVLIKQEKAPLPPLPAKTGKDAAADIEQVLIKQDKAPLPPLPAKIDSAAPKEDAFDDLVSLKRHRDDSDCDSFFANCSFKMPHAVKVAKLAQADHNSVLQEMGVKESNLKTGMILPSMGSKVVLNRRKNGSMELLLYVKKVGDLIIDGHLQQHFEVTVLVKGAYSVGNQVLLAPRTGLPMVWSWDQMAMVCKVASEERLNRQVSLAQSVADSLHKDMTVKLPNGFRFTDEMHGWCLLDVTKDTLSERVYLTVEGDVAALLDVCHANALQDGGVCVVDDGGVMTKATGTRLAAWKEVASVAQREGLRVWSTTIPSLCLKGTKVSARSCLRGVKV